MSTSRNDLNALTEKVIGAAIEVHRILGPGLLESVYRECLAVELTTQGLTFKSEQRIPMEYKGHPIKGTLQIDLLIEDCLVVELKAVEVVHPVCLAQVITYLKLTGCPAGLLVNFNTTSLRSGLRRLDHPDLYVKKKSPRDPRDLDFS